MGRPKTGTVWRSPDNTELKARITVKDNLGRTRRPWLELDPKTSDENARKIALLVSKEAEGQPYDPARFKRAKELSKSPTVEDFVEKVWFPSRVGKIASIRQDRSRWKHHLGPLIGHLKMVEVTTDHLRLVVEALDDKAANNAGVNGRSFGEKSAVNCWTQLQALFRDACASKRKEIRILDKRPNPTREVLPPDGPGEIEKQWLFPSELHQLLACTDVDLYRRWVYACAVFLFCRPGEVLALLWGASIDLEHNMARINRAWNSEEKVFNEYTKTGDTRHFTLEPVLRPLLAAIRARAPEGERLVFPRRFELAVQLRADLWTAGVRREALHVKRKGSRMMRFHDLRATGITYLALRGETDHTVRDRAGHTDIKTTLEYIRRGQHAAGATLGDPFAPLPHQLLGLPGVISSGTNVPSGGDRGVNAEGSANSAGDVTPRPLTEGVEEAPDQASGGNDRATSASLDAAQDDKKTISGHPELSAKLEGYETAMRGLALSDPRSATRALAVCAGTRAVFAGDLDAARQHLAEGAATIDEDDLPALGLAGGGEQ